MYTYMCCCTYVRLHLWYRAVTDAVVCHSFAEASSDNLHAVYVLRIETDTGDRQSRHLYRASAFC